MAKKGFSKLEHELPSDLPKLFPASVHRAYRGARSILQQRYSKREIREFIRQERNLRMAIIGQGLTRPSSAAGGKQLLRVPPSNIPPGAQHSVRNLVDALDDARAIADDGFDYEAYLGKTASEQWKKRLNKNRTKKPTDKSAKDRREIKETWESFCRDKAEERLMADPKLPIKKLAWEIFKENKLILLGCRVKKSSTVEKALKGIKRPKSLKKK